MRKANRNGRIITHVTCTAHPDFFMKDAPKWVLDDCD